MNTVIEIEMPELIKIDSSEEIKSSQEDISIWPPEKKDSIKLPDIKRYKYVDEYYS